jgi:membrane protease YdiL (CAAX protease family)
MRRRPTRYGSAPKVSGMPTFVVLNVLSVVYLALLVWSAVARDAKQTSATFLVHMFGVLGLGAAAGMLRGAVRLKVRGMRDDTFLEPLPLRLPARLGLQLIDSYMFVPFAAIVPLAAMIARGAFGASTLLASLLGLLAFVASFIAGLASITWARALGPAAVGRFGLYLAVFGNVASLLGITLPIAPAFAHHGARLGARIASLWIGPRPAFALLYGVVLVFGAACYRALSAAERMGVDQLDVQRSAPKPGAPARDRIGLEWTMLLRQGGRAALVLYSAFVLGALVLLVVVARHPASKSTPSVLLSMAALVVYLGTATAIGQAGRAATADALARPFLAALPLSPHHVLDGKARALRRVLVPLLLILAMFCAAFIARSELDKAYRVALALLALYVVVDGAASVAFLSTGIGVVGIGGGSASSGFSTQVLMLPLFATVLAPNDWAATTAFIAVLAIRREALRAARMSVRWLDDPADDIERETTVWRALLAATAFFAMQALTYRLLATFPVPRGYLFAGAFASSAVLLAALTWRNGHRFERPRFLPRKRLYWPLGALAGGASGMLALRIAKLWPAPDQPDAVVYSQGELVAMFCTMTIIAPLVEEYFFRGWLQKAIEADLPAPHKRWAFALGAAAFALAHFGTYGVPQLVLGLLAGGLFALGGGLWPAILAHAIHNGVVLLAS